MEIGISGFGWEKVGRGLYFFVPFLI